ncbi:MAG: hypothetical protein AAFN51_10070 [Pseudomonadota bacterium]
MIEITRVQDGPIIHQAMHPSLGDNINGPSLIHIPDSIADPLGRYYLYFSHHKGQHIRLAFANRVEGPWTIHPSGVMPLETSPFAQTKPDVPQPAWAVVQNTDGLYPHLASPDVLIEPDGALQMYVHGLDASGEQVTHHAVSADGLDWSFKELVIPDTYLRIFDWRGSTYAMARCSRIWRKGPTGWEAGEIGIDPSVRHVAVLLRGSLLQVLYTRIGDAPEHLLHTSIELGSDWRKWRPSAPPTAVLYPERNWEGAGLPASPSQIGAVDFANALRDPCLFEDQDKVWLVYAGGGEDALGLAEITGL